MITRDGANQLSVDTLISANAIIGKIIDGKIIDGKIILLKR